MDTFVKRSMGAYRTVIAHAGVAAIRIPLTGTSFEKKTWNGIALAIATARALARLKRVDPRKTRLIDELKRLVR